MLGEEAKGRCTLSADHSAYLCAFPRDNGFLHAGYRNAVPTIRFFDAYVTIAFDIKSVECA
jgi:hypothetical protein